ncbi:MAG TPA: DUF4142 domain-containing protein [Chthoniobacterales bacterium]|nr:DUF4142 domain-containing protein [Chthoniobacterales bacterium]
MKKQLSSVKQLTAMAVGVGLVCFASLANSQETYAPSGATGSEKASSDKKSATAADEPVKEPTKVGSMAAVGQKPRKGDAQKAGTTTTPQTAGGASTKGAEAAQPGANQMSDMDRPFMMQAAKDGMKEVHMGEMAAQQGQSDTVKKLGQMIVSDHQKANQQLMAIAAKKGVKPDTRAVEHGMSKRDMKNFDQAWIAGMINDHTKDIGLYQRQSQQGGDPELRAFAKKTLPVLQKHLKMVQQAQQKMGSGATNPTGMGAEAGETRGTGSTAKKGG